MIKLFVVGYPLDIEDVELIELFSIQGMIHSIHLLTDKVTHKHKGYGFIEMVDQAGADRAIANLNGMVMKGRKLTVKLADEDREKKPKAFKSNHFPAQDRQASQNTEEGFKSKRPRKLISEGK
ncbi:RNA recognition motif domain-containing protein [Pedobacter frigoris]|uniref:RNA-binding protein n=1 Tax=Pedobacter frigoris TaxID=2571272 RepID=A0A4U1CSF4_9SPHI|nr:RNA-binding protein [Pedobacter frigoris]TKC08859.1 RNA-binding protein [Pedobacter frigoris]